MDMSSGSGVLVLKPTNIRYTVELSQLMLNADPGLLCHRLEAAKRPKSKAYAEGKEAMLAALGHAVPSRKYIGAIGPLPGTKKATQ